MEQVISASSRAGYRQIAEDGRCRVVTAGDLTRIAERMPDYLALVANDVMTRTPRHTGADDLAAAAVGEMERHAIMAAPVLDATGAIVGVVHLHDLLRAGAV